MKRTPRTAVIQDLSCIGRCSLGVAMAVLPAMGVEAAVLPTAILSTHTAFQGFTFMDFTPEAEKVMDHWQALGFTFDSIYIGYLGSLDLIELTGRFLDRFATLGVQVILDPAFGDNGKLYPIFDDAYVRGMRALCARADIILPNRTEACFLLDMPYGEGEAHTSQVEARAAELLQGKLRDVVITSCRFSEGRTGLICVGDHAFRYPHAELSLSCHGSGDLFASVFAGHMLACGDVERAARFAADFTRDCLDYSMKCPDHRWYGVDFEAMLPELIRRLNAEG